MAYTASVSLARSSSDGHLIIEITETEVAATSETSINLSAYTGARGGQWWTLIRQHSVLNTGLGSTVNPILGTTTNPSGVAVILSTSASADAKTDPTGGIVFCTATAASPQNVTVYHRSRPDTGGNNSVTTRYIFKRIGL